MSEGLFDLLYIIDSTITSIMKIFIIVLICRIVFSFKKNCNLLNRGEIK